MLNFQHDRTAKEPERPDSTPQTWMEGNLTEAEMIVNWEKLPIVTSDREGVVPRTPEWPLIAHDKICCAESLWDCRAARMWRVPWA